MLTEGDVFPNMGLSNPAHVRRLTLQERARLRMCPFFLTASDLLQTSGRLDCDDPDEIQDACSKPAPRT
jgi:hypothetical protein